MSKDDFTEFYFKENEKLLLKVIESVNTTIDQIIQLITRISLDDKFTVVVIEEI